MKAFIFLIALFAVTFAYEELRIVQPEGLRDQFKDGVRNRPALFGVPPYGVSITGKVFYATPGDLDGCKPLNSSSASWPEPSDTFIVMIDRGECTFVQKVSHAQAVGATAVIVVDNVDETVLPFMADDGSGGSLTTPSLLIGRRDGAIIKDAMKDGNIVVVTMKWNVPHPDGRVEWSVWTSSHDPNSEGFKKNFADASKALGTSAQFSVHYFFLHGTDYGCTGSSGTACGNQCTNGGRYCAVDPEHDLKRGLDGADVVRENTRQACLFRVQNRTQSLDKWWDYVNLFNSACGGQKSTFNEKCSVESMKKVGVDSAAVMKCVNDAGGYSDTSGTNTVIDEELALRREKGVYFLPTITVNNMQYRGALACPAPIDVSRCGVLSAICAGFAEGTEPQACTTATGCPLGQVRDECGNCGGNGTKDACGNCFAADHPDRRDDPKLCNEVYISTANRMSTGTVVAIVFGFVAISGVGFVFFHRRSQANMRRELAEIMQQYAPLDESSPTNPRANLVSTGQSTGYGNL